MPLPSGALTGFKNTEVYCLFVDPFSSQDNESLYQMPGSCFDYLLNTYTVKAGKSRLA